jgi:hypothetical protein
MTITIIEDTTAVSIDPNINGTDIAHRMMEE